MIPEKGSAALPLQRIHFVTGHIVIVCCVRAETAERTCFLPLIIPLFFVFLGSGIAAKGGGNTLQSCTWDILITKIPRGVPDWFCETDQRPVGEIIKAVNVGIPSLVSQKSQ